MDGVAEMPVEDRQWLRVAQVFHAATQGQSLPIMRGGCRFPMWRRGWSRTCRAWAPRTVVASADIDCSIWHRRSLCRQRQSRPSGREAGSSGTCAQRRRRRSQTLQDRTSVTAQSRHTMSAGAIWRPGLTHGFSRRGSSCGLAADVDFDRDRRRGDELHSFRMHAHHRLARRTSNRHASSRGYLRISRAPRNKRQVAAGFRAREGQFPSLRRTWLRDGGSDRVDSVVKG